MPKLWSEGILRDVWSLIVMPWWIDLHATLTGLCVEKIYLSQLSIHLLAPTNRWSNLAPLARFGFILFFIFHLKKFWPCTVICKLASSLWIKNFKIIAVLLVSLCVIWVTRLSLHCYFVLGWYWYFIKWIKSYCWYKLSYWFGYVTLCMLSVVRVRWLMYHTVSPTDE